tara:strand:- start:38842 stop:39921 length:1080 start_codon:yes stop_codon:yes gene_type:complete
VAVKIIAEAGVNHNGDFDLAAQLVEAGAKAGADVIKFQTFQAHLVATANAEQAQYQKKNLQGNDSQLEMLRKLELKKDCHWELKAQCESLGVEFMSTPFDRDSIRFLVDELGVTSLKIPSGELTNGPLLLAFARSGCDLILSTGMANSDEVERALALIGWGMTIPTRLPSGEQEFREAWHDELVRERLCDKITVLHCTSQYPAPPETVNLRAMNTLSQQFGLPVGYSDHTAGISIPVAAAAKGAVVIEKHFTLDRNMTGPDHRASLEPMELTQMVAGVRSVELALGDGVKAPHNCEKNTADVARRSLVAAESISAGKVFTHQNVVARRPGTGVSPMRYWDLIGTVAKRDYLAGELLESD